MLHVLAMVLAVVAFLPGFLRAAESPAWTLRDSTTTQALNDVAGNGTLFVVVGDSGVILTSPDAMTWKPQVSPTRQNLNGVAWFHDRFVAVGNNGVILLSLDGLSWTIQDSHSNSNLRDIAAGPSTLVAVGERGAVLYSLNGEAWATITTSRSLPTRASRAGFTPQRRNFLHVLGTPHGFLIPTGDSIMLSTQGLAWTSTSIVPGRDPFVSGPVARGPAKKASTPASNGNPPVASVQRSGLAIRGRAGSLARAGAAAESLTAAAQSDDLIVAVSDTGGIWTFPKGGNWSRLDKPLPEDFKDKLSDVYWSGRHFLAVGGNGALASSIDGLHWQKVAVPTMESLVAVSGQPGLLVAVGANGTILTRDDHPVVAQPSIDPAGGLFTSRPLVTLNCSTPGATLHYTTDGTEPSEDSTIYDQPFPMPKPGALRVRAYKDGMDESLEASAVFRPPVLAQITESTGQVRVPLASTNPVVYFVVKISGAIPAPAFQWQRKAVGGQAWVNYPAASDNSEAQSKMLGYSLNERQWKLYHGIEAKSGADTSVLEVQYDSSMNGDHFRCIVSNAAGDVVSPEAELLLYQPIPVSEIKPPESAYVQAGHEATFTVGVNVGDPAPVFQWIISDPHGKERPLEDGGEYSGTQTNTLTIKETSVKMSGALFYCTFTNDYQNTPPAFNQTVPVSLEVWSLIVRQPRPATVQEGDDATFSIETREGAELRYQWECQPSPKSSWQPLQDGPSYAGVTGNTLVVHYPVMTMSGCKYRCVIDDGHGQDQEVSVAVVLTVRK